MRQVDASDIKGVWAEVVRAAGHLRGMTSLGKAMAIQQIKGRDVTVAMKPGNRRYVTERQKTQLAQLLTKVLGHPVSVQIAKRQASAQDAAEEQGSDAGISQRQQAMQLPLVQQINEIFDVSLVEVAKDKDPTLALSDVDRDDDMDQTQEEDDEDV